MHANKVEERFMDMEFHPQQPGHSHEPQPVIMRSHEFASGSPQPKPVETQAPGLANAVSTKPVPVVRVLSPVGVEYVFLTLTLIAGAIALIAALIALVNDKTDFSVLAFPTATLVVTLPVFGGLFLHLKKVESDVPELRLDPSKRRSTQFTQIVAFAACLFTLIGFVFDIFSKIGGQSGPTIIKAGLDALCVLVVAGGILAYYWRDERKFRR